ncbi:MAG: 7,8-didemethyl-8-hydroxy-5-deazariboflavin synthase [Subtercola sp.]|nr:7,8-didemethyl-8-hydroxy-5-deazariboflavin synthase [Subtercola sp.]
MPAVRLPSLSATRTIGGGASSARAFSEPAVGAGTPVIQRFTPRAAELQDALASAEAGHPLAPQQYETLLHARGESLERLLEVASALRDEGLAAAGRPGIITYSRKVFIPLTHLCQDRCHYCIFVSTPGKLAKEGKAPYLPIEEVLEVARAGAAMGCKEALFTLGDRPENRWPAARAWLDEHGYASTLDYVADAAQRVLDETGLLPHLNPGVMTWAEMQRLKPVGPSMGMMLETTATRLWSEKSGAHYGSPDKDPAVRLRVLDDAGRSKIPFTTGVLFGIGENYAERVDSMLAIRASARLWGHVQETIVQNFRAKDATAMMHEVDLETEEYIASVAVTRLVMGADARLQAPPNLTDAAELALLIRAGIDDWGGVSPLTPDHVNPERPWPQIDELARLTAASGFELRERLTAHPHYIREPEGWIDDAVLPAVLALADASGLARVDDLARVGASARVGGVARAAGPSDGAAAAVPDGATAATNKELSSTEENTGSKASISFFVDDPAEIRDALSAAEAIPAGLSDREYELLLGARGDELEQLARLADAVREEALGATLTYAVNRNLDSSLVRARRAPGILTLDDVETLAAEAWELGATEICMQGAAHADLGPTAYADLVRAVKRGALGLHLHAFRPAELLDGAQRAGLSLDEHLAELRSAGLDSVPGTGARILDDDIRARLSGGTDLPSAEWMRVITAAHRAGLRSTATMVYGHIETPAQQVAHLRTLLRMHDETGGFTEFIPMPFVPADAPPVASAPVEKTPVHGSSEADRSRNGHDRPRHGHDRSATGPDRRETRALHAVARLMLAGRIDHVQAAWTKLGFADSRAVLRGGADDLGGLLLDGSINAAAGAEAGRSLELTDVNATAAALGREARQRSTLYAPVEASIRVG